MGTWRSMLGPGGKGLDGLVVEPSAVRCEVRGRYAVVTCLEEVVQAPKSGGGHVSAGRADGARKKKRANTMHATNVFQKLEGRWHMVHHHASPVPVPSSRQGMQGASGRRGRSGRGSGLGSSGDGGDSDEDDDAGLAVQILGSGGDTSSAIGEAISEAIAKAGGGAGLEITLNVEDEDEGGSVVELEEDDPDLLDGPEGSAAGGVTVAFTDGLLGVLQVQRLAPCPAWSPPSLTTHASRGWHAGTCQPKAELATSPCFTSQA